MTGLISKLILKRSWKQPSWIRGRSLRTVAKERRCEQGPLCPPPRPHYSDRTQSHASSTSLGPKVFSSIGVSGEKIFIIAAAQAGAPTTPYFRTCQLAWACADIDLASNTA